MHDGASMTWASNGRRESSSMQKLPPAMASRKILPRCPPSPTMAKVCFRTLSSGSVVGTVPRAGNTDRTGRKPLGRRGGDKKTWRRRQLPRLSYGYTKSASFLQPAKYIEVPKGLGLEQSAAHSGRRILVRVWIVKVSFRIRADDDDDLDGGYNGTPLALQLGRGAWQTWDHPTTAWHRGARTISQGLSRSPTESPAGKHQISVARLDSLV
ncbi:hypothetical protein CMUS01_00549 [Colletotrichum musicola]|uniref:Uncharacterized protein n=1 Tax=Colletotrichum musicola TaxID=2175873 RepID=A0A8H6U9F9_9PEZI|nr:hypothetical protein CMUS01_00549 [Colletotrichum musicola]